jgi:general L-amino acid transport system permease protein
MNAATETLNFVRHQQVDPAPPPRLVRGPLAWMRENLFSSIPNTILTLATLYLLYILVPPIAKFFFIDAVWVGADRDACRAETAGRPIGACWAYVIQKINYFIYGSYPITERWRVNAFFGLLAIGVAWMLWLDAPRRGLGAIYFFVIMPVLSFLLLAGSKTLSLPLVQTSLWGGILVTDRGLGGRHRILAALRDPAGARSTLESADRPALLGDFHRVRPRRAAHHRAVHGQHHAAAVPQ